MRWTPVRSRIRSNSILGLVTTSLIKIYMLFLGLLFMLKQQPARSHQISEQTRSAVERVFTSASDIRTISIVLTEIEREEIRKSGVPLVLRLLTKLWARTS
jgi:hypothetical protein